MSCRQLSCKGSTATEKEASSVKKEESSLKKGTSILLSDEDHVMLKKLAEHWRRTPSDVLRAALTELLTVLQRQPDLLPLPPLPSQVGGSNRTSVRMGTVDLGVAELIKQLTGDKNRTSMMRRALRLLHSELTERWRQPRPLTFRRGELTNRLIDRLERDPAVLDMREFAMLTNGGDDMVFGLAGLILDESGVIMDFEEDLAVGLMGYGERMEFDLLAHDEDEALGLARLQLMPQPKWINYDVAIVRGRQGLAITPLDVMIPATAREIWAAEHGEHAALQLPLYAADWPVPHDQITAETIREYLLAVKCGRYKPSAA
jgi:hypothetical protein